MSYRGSQENFQKNKIDVILCDINIPKLNGLDVVNNIRKANNDVVIIMVSAYSDSETLLKALNSLIQGYIVKPITSNKVKNILEKIEYHQNKDHPNQKIKLNDFITLDLLNSSIIVNDKIVYLTKKEMLFLNLLFKPLSVNLYLYFLNTFLHAALNSSIKEKFL